MLWTFARVYNARRQYNDHRQPVDYAMRHPSLNGNGGDGARRGRELFVHRNERTRQTESVSNN